MKNSFVKVLHEAMGANDNLFLLTGDLGYGMMESIMTDYPDKFINMGICEQNMASVAAGMALEGATVFIYSIGNFPTLRCLEQIRNDIAYHNANVKIVAVGGGFAYGALGMSHHATEDLSIMRSIPNMKVLCPGDIYEAMEAVKYAIKTDGPVYIRLGKGKEPDILHSEENILKINEINCDKNGNIRIAVLATGAPVAELDGISHSECTISTYSVPSIKPVDIDGIEKICTKNDLVISMEEHNVIGGLGSIIQEIMVERNCVKPLIKLGLNDEFTSAVGDREYLRSIYGIDKSRVILEIEKYIEKNKYE